MPEEGQARVLTKRYKDAYAVGRVTVAFGKTIKGIGIGVAGLMALIAIGILQSSSTIGMGALVFALVVGGLFYILGVLISASGQVLEATLDTAVNSSPFLNNSHRADIMSLGRGPAIVPPPSTVSEGDSDVASAEGTVAAGPVSDVRHLSPGTRVVTPRGNATVRSTKGIVELPNGNATGTVEVDLDSGGTIAVRPDQLTWQSATSVNSHLVSPKGEQYVCSRCGQTRAATTDYNLFSCGPAD